MCALYIYTYIHTMVLPGSVLLGGLRSSMIPGQHMIDGKMISTAKT